MKLNCWEFKKCGKEPGGVNNGQRGTCPAATDHRLDGIHGGNNAGRACWAIPETLCNGDTSGDFVKKYKDCHECDFFKAVAREEGADFVFTVKLHEKLYSNTVDISVYRPSETK